MNHGLWIELLVKKAQNLRVKVMYLNSKEVAFSPSMYYRSWLAANMDKSTNKNKTQNCK
jgi:hypothetical protein